ncbi:single-stranded DNA-binding protein [Lentilactobacillus senioris]|uniref:single-stranded DNA-binding protein n=1 Tax=Lentilactobacillus senioris TaxID=931534 RepID=UPI00227DB10D|nr:single-stranded DNA-binding protein [Lentilactobacillus senioris]MCY9806538.1 single-stranded DNA-binding protein [Lentilactobacillus senioris]
MLNRVTLTGRLTKDADLRYTQGGTAVGTFNLAVNRNFKNQQGEREADFVSCVIWRKSAENFANFTHKGALVGIDGRIQTRNYENQQGNRVYVTEVIVENFALLESRDTNSNGNSNRNNQAGNPYAGDPFANSSDPFANNGDPIDISDDDLPFD